MSDMVQPRETDKGIVQPCKLIWQASVISTTLERLNNPKGRHIVGKCQLVPVFQIVVKELAEDDELETYTTLELFI